MGRDEFWTVALSGLREDERVVMMKREVEEAFHPWRRRTFSSAQLSK